MDGFFLDQTPPNSFICNQNNYKHAADMDIYVLIHEPCNLQMIGMYKNMSKWEVVVVLFWCVGSPCEGVDSDQQLSLQCKYCVNIKDVYAGKSNMFY